MSDRFVATVNIVIKRSHEGVQLSRNRSPVRERAFIDPDSNVALSWTPDFVSKSWNRHMPFPLTRAFAFIIAALASLASPPAAAQVPPALVEFTVAGKVQQGLRLVEFAHETVIIGRDGWLHSLQSSPDIRPVAGEYEPLPAAQMRNQLRSEFGRDFEVIATQHFLVVQPFGRGDRWPNMFEQSHRAFLSYMRRHNVQVREGRFPMVAVVFPDETAMNRELRQLKIDMSRVSGVYANSSNRIITHDGGRHDTIASTLRHEAAHQSAFNSGVHSRINDTPKWITEGVGQMFEPAAMGDARTSGKHRDTVNHESLARLRKEFDLGNPVALASTITSLVGDDTMFKDSKKIETAYAVSWAMMYYLANRQSDAFATVLNDTSNRPPFINYPRAEKLKDFQAATGCDAYEMSKRITRYLETM